MRRLRFPVLVAVLVAMLAALLVGPGAVTAATQVPPTQVPPTQVLPTGWRWVVVPAAAFHPERDGIDYINSGTVLSLGHDGWWEEEFLAPLFFDSPVTVHKMVLYATDSHYEKNVCVTLYRTPAGSRTRQEMGSICSNAYSDTTHRFFAQTAFSKPNAPSGYGVFLEIDLPAPINEVGWNLTFEGVKIAYTLDT